MGRVSVFAPASVANISCGFDVLGVCLDSVGDILHIEEASKPGIEITEIIDNYYKDIQDMGGNRWDTSSLLKRLQ